MEALEIAKRQLRILTVNLRSSELGLRDDMDVRSLSDDDLATRQQGYHTVGGVTESQLHLSDEVNCWEYRFEYSVGVRLVSVEEWEQRESDDAIRPLLSVEAVFTATYIAEEQVDEEAIEAFAKDNVGYHVWPYWREYVQSCSSRMGLGPVFQVPHYIVENHS